IREDLYSLVFTLVTILAFRAFLDTDRSRWLTTSAVSFALAGLTKETVYMTAIVFLVFGAWLFLERALADPSPAAGFRTTLHATVRWGAERWLPFLAAGLLFVFIWALGYSAFGRYPQDWLAIPKAVHYWMGQHAIARIGGPWYYYVPQLLYYETATVLAFLLLARRRDLRGDPLVRSVLIGTLGLTLAASTPSLIGWGRVGKNLALLFLLAGVVGAIAALRVWQPRRGVVPPFLRFVVYWAFASLAIYGWAREKVPWLTVHPLLPITILAGVLLADLWAERRTRRAIFSLAAVVLLLAINTSGMLLACFRYGAYDVDRDPKHGEYLAYVQTTWDLVRALRFVDIAKSRVPAGQPAVTVTGEATWPLSWYLRDVNTRWTGRLEAAETPVLIADWNAEGSLDKQLAARYDAKRVPIRAWWFPDDFFSKGFREKTRWWLFHELWSQIGSQDCVFYVRKDLEGSGPLEPIRVPIQDTNIRDYPSDAAPIAPQRAF
ncbi:MAG TPA: flippase activity-associated protein Agl23, partial [Thermoanaerobaculia bacterium]|nr:flippase activity-associated protein Agl23 [Thermoanaerobaculia bacterium]